MVGTALLLKMLQCKVNHQRKAKAEHNHKPSSALRPSKRKTGSRFTTVEVKIEPNDNAHQTCRVCLEEGSIPIFGNEKDTDLSRDLNLFGGIEVQWNDVHPKYICVSCNSLLKGAILFRNTAQKSDLFLQQVDKRNSAKEEPEVLSAPSDYEDIEVLSMHDNVSDSDDEDTIYGKSNSFNCEIKKELLLEEKTVGNRYQCIRCDLLFETQSELKKHKSSTEHENKKLSCPVCQQEYAPAYLKRHMLLHSMKTPYICDICGKTCTVSGQLSRHRATHFLELPFQCSLCPYKGRFKESLKMHMRSHTGDKPYQCPHCPTRTFTNKSNMNRHMLTHKEDHDFKCDICNRGFYTKRERDTHFKVDHTGIREHICSICGKAFGYRKQMMKHQVKVHKREKLRSGRTPLYLIAEKKRDKSKKVPQEIVQTTLNECPD